MIFKRDSIAKVEMHFPVIWLSCYSVLKAQNPQSLSLWFLQLQREVLVLSLD